MSISDLSAFEGKLNIPGLPIIQFPDPLQLGPEQQIVCYSDQMDASLLYSAYLQGIFPWFNEDEGDPVLWYSPNPRFVLEPQNFHVPASLKKFLKHCPFEFTMDHCFEDVIMECSRQVRPGQNGTWIGSQIIENYTTLHHLGICHSFEAWQDDHLAGGFFGELIGSIFFGESMFTKVSNSSKCVFVKFMESFIKSGGKLIDCQTYTDNLARYGAHNISREAFFKFEELYLTRKINFKFLDI